MLKFKAGELVVIDKDTLAALLKNPFCHFDEIQLTPTIEYYLSILNKQYSYHRSINILRDLYWTSGLAFEEFEKNIGDLLEKKYASQNLIRPSVVSLESFELPSSFSPPFA